MSVYNALFNEDDEPAREEMIQIIKENLASYRAISSDTNIFEVSTNEDQKEAQDILISAFYEVLEGYAEPDLEENNLAYYSFLGEPNDDFKSNVWSKYVNLYSREPAPTLNDLSRINNEFVWSIDGEYLINDDGSINQPIIERLLEKRQEGLLKCARDETLSNEERQFFLKESKKQVLGCNDITWGRSDKVTIACEDIGDIPHMNTTGHTDKTRQYVFGNYTNVTDYVKCPLYFRSMMMESSESSELCGEMTQWTSHFNDLFTICASQLNTDLPIRFILNDGTIRPRKYGVQYALWSEKYKKFFFESDFAGIMEIKYLENRKVTGRKLGKENRLFYFIFINDAPIMRNQYSGTFLKWRIYDSFGHRYNIGEAFRFKNITYREFNLLVNWMGRNDSLKVYQSNIDRNILFFSKRELTPEKLEKYNIKRIHYRVVKDNNIIKFLRVIPRSELAGYAKQNIYQQGSNIYASDDKLSGTFLKKYGVKTLYLPSMSGGGNGIRMRTAKKYELENNILAPGAKRFIELNNELLTFGLSSYKDFINNIVLSNKVYLYSLITTGTFSIYEKQNVEVIRKKDRYYKFSELLSTKFNQSILQYKPLSQGFFTCHEILHKFDILKDNAIEVSNGTSALEAITYYQNKYKKNKYRLHWMYMKRYPYSVRKLNESPNEKAFEYYKQYKKLSIIVKEDFINPNTFYDDTRKYGLIWWSLVMSSPLHMMDDNLNIVPTLYGLLYILTNLEIGGNAVIYIRQVIIKPMADIVLLAKSVFKEVILYSAKSAHPFKMAGVSLIMKSYKGTPENILDKLMEIAKKIYKRDPSGIKVNMPKGKNRNDINKLWHGFASESNTTFDQNYDYVFIKEFLSKPLSDASYDFIKEFNRQLYFRKNIYLDSLLEYMEAGEEERRELDARYSKEKLIAAVLWAKEFDMETVPIEGKAFESKFSKILLEDMYSYNHPVQFTFRQPSRNSNKTANVSTLEHIEQLARDFFMTGFIIDTRNIEDYNRIKKEIRFYHPLKKELRLTSLIEKTFQYPDGISQAWLKMYEIAEKFPLLKKNGAVVKTFHMCEAPGNFISALNHYIFSKTRISTFDWHAQSLKPRNKNRTAFGDDYGYIGRYPDRWDWGKDGSGDITKPENIKYYGEKYVSDADLVTSDCGLPWTGNEDDRLLYVHFVEMFIILKYLRPGASFVAKYVLPMVHPLEISLMYIIWQSFSSVSFFKPLQNPHSGEFYLIGIGYSGASPKNLSRLEKCVHHFNKDVYLFKEFREEFMRQLVKGLTELTEHFTEAISRQIYYVDNYDQITPEHRRELERMIAQKNKDWVRQFKLKKIPVNKHL